jgi:YfiH family protein
MNLGGSTGDSPEAVERNLVHLSRQVGLAREKLHTAHQVHGRAVAQVVSGEVPSTLGEADALVATVPGAWVGVRTADCVPILLVDPDTGNVSAVHSGWRGTKLRVVEAAIAALVVQGSKPERLLAAVGPAIGVCCYQVSAELAHDFGSEFGPQVTRKGTHGPHLDLVLAVRQTLVACGLKPGSVDVLGRCTACEPQTFYSHRRDQGRTGRHLSFIACAKV